MSFTKKYPIAPTFYQLLQQATFHLGVVRDVKDPHGRGRVRVECESLWGKGKQNWSYWLELCTFPIGSSYKDGDHGIWWIPVPGERVLVGFIGGEHHGGFVIPGPPWQSQPGESQEIIPLEAKKITDEDVRKGTRLRVIKSESGGTLFWDDNGEQECAFLVDWTGAGIFWDAPGKEEDVQERKGDPSYFRSAERRQTKTTAAQTTKKPSEIVKSGSAIVGLMDLNGQGLFQVATDGAGVVTLVANNSMGQEGPSIVLDASNNLVVLTAGEAQLQVKGKDGYVAVTRQIIDEQEKIETSGLFSAIWDRLKSTFKRYHVEDPNDQGQGKPRGTITV